MGSKKCKINGSGCRNLSSIELIKMDDMPERILFEVLVRLPVKVLFKCKIVSKQWLSMISDPSFARMYVSRASMLSQHSENWTLINSYLDEATSPTAQHLPVIKVPQHECSLGTNCPQHRFLLPCAQRVDDFNYRIVGVSNGLVLYNVGHRGRIYGYYISNLITEQWITLPPTKHGFKVVSTGFVTQVEDNVLASYRVVRLDSCLRGSVFKFTVYFSEICRWEGFDIDFGEEIYFYVWKKATVLDKILHQMISGHRIMAYDPYNKPDSVRLISLPGVSFESYGRNRIDFDESLLDEHQGNLRYFVVALDGQLNEFSGSLCIWVLNDYDLGEWSLQHRVNIGDIQYDGGVSSVPAPLSFHPFDPNIVFMINKQALFSYDLKTRKLKIEDDSTRSYPLGFPCDSYFLFVIPPWPVSINPSSIEVTKD